MINSQQIIEGDEECRMHHEKWSETALRDYQGKKSDIDSLIGSVNALNNLLDTGALSPQFGAGSPEGVVSANFSLKYIDTSVPTEYYNQTLGSITGWVAL